MPQPKPDVLHYLLTRTGTKWAAHCLDYDLVVVHENREEAERRLNFLVRGHVEVAEARPAPAALAHKAPEQYWQKFRAVLDTSSANVQMDPIERSVSRWEVGVVTAVAA